MSESTPAPGTHTVRRYEKDGVTYEDHRWYAPGGTILWGELDDDLKQLVADAEQVDAERRSRRAKDE